jgi:hypothetical protein
MNNRQVAHLWANKARDGAKGSHFYFNGATIYSYGPHFPIARHIERNGKSAILFTTKSYSISTSKHISYARGAIREHALVIHTADVTREPKSAELRKEYESRLTDVMDNLARARTHKDIHAQSAGRIAREGNAAAEFFGWTWRLTVPHFSDEWLEEQRAKLREQQKKQDAKFKRQREAAEKEAAERIQRWRAGESVTVNHGDIMLRVKDESIQTSRGAEIPVSHAPRLWRVIQRAVNGEPYKANGHSEHAGEFKVDSVDTDGTMRAGCHTIKFEELKRLAVTLGLAV